MALKFFDKLRRHGPDIEKYLEYGRASLARGDLKSAAEGFNRVLQAEPLHWESLAAIGPIAVQNGDWASAIRVYGAMIEQKPLLPEPYYKRGNAFVAQGSWDQALADFDRATSLDPRYGFAWCNRGVVLDRMGRAIEAIESLQRALSVNAGDATAALNLASLLARLHRSTEALPYLMSALESNPVNSDLHYLRGVLLHATGQYDDAVASFDRAGQHGGDAGRVAATYANRGASLAALGRLEDAVLSYDMALRLRPDARLFVQRGLIRQSEHAFEQAAADFSAALQFDATSISARLGLGRALRNLRKLDAALDCYTCILEQDSINLEAQVQRGNILLELNRLQGAKDSFDTSLQWDSECLEALQGRAFTLMAMNRPEDAIRDLDRVLAVNPQQRYILGMNRYLKMQICEWAGFEDDLTALQIGLEESRPVSIPHVVLALFDVPRLQQRAAHIWVAEEFPSQAIPAPLPPRQRERIRVGYFSPDFGDHPVARQAIQLFESHDRSRFEIFGFSLGGDATGPLRARLLAAFDHFINVGEQSDTDIAQLCRSLGIDVAVDLGGHTEHCRTGIFARRVAAVQLSYLGYLGTLGAPYIDYLLVDATLVPEESRAYYSERMVYLPSYQVNDGNRQIAANGFTRCALGLPAEGFVYGCFNASYKIAPNTFATWMRILKRVAGSVLFLYVNNVVARRNLVAAARAHGVKGERLMFGARLPTEQYLARFRAIDLFLDTWPYNAGTTGSDALWAGLPVLTLAGRSFAARIGCSLLHAAGLSELVTESVESYEELAVVLAADPARLRELRHRLEEAKISSKLFDTPRFTRSVESAFTRMCLRSDTGQAPEDFVVVEY